MQTHTRVSQISVSLLFTAICYAIFMPIAYAQAQAQEAPARDAISTQPLDVWADVINLWQQFVLALPMLSLGLVFFVLCYLLHNAELSLHLNNIINFKRFLHA